MKQTDLKQFLKSDNRLEVRPSAVSIYIGKPFYEIFPKVFTINVMLIHRINAILSTGINPP